MQDLARQDTRSNPIAQWLSDTVQDLRHTFRGMRRDAGFTTFVILIAGHRHRRQLHDLQRGERAAAASVAIRDPRRLVWIANEEWNTQVSAISGFAGSEQVILRSGRVRRLRRRRHGTHRRRRARAADECCRNPELLHLARREADIGRIVHSRGMPGKNSDNPPAALLSYGFWQRRFASDPAVVGRKLTLNNKPVTSSECCRRPSISRAFLAGHWRSTLHSVASDRGNESLRKHARRRSEG